MISQAFDRMARSSADLSWVERSISVAIGLALAAAGGRPRPNTLLSVLALGIGSYLAYRGATGHCPLKAALIANRNLPARIAGDR